MPAALPANLLNESGHRLSRLEESYLQLNREVMHIDEITRDLRHELENLALRMAELHDEAVPATPAPMEPVVSTALELVPLTARTDLVATDDLDRFVNMIEDTAKKVDELSAMVDAQRRTLLAIGQVLSQLPDWRKLKTSMADSLEQVVTAFEAESRPRKSG
jgi:phytoene dehydrogenase-like protein